MRLWNNIQEIFLGFRRIRERKLLVQARLRTLSSLMNPGWYRIEHSLAWRLGSDPPDGLKQTKRRPWKSEDFLASLRSLVSFWLTPPLFTRIGPSGGNAGDYDQLLLTSHGDTKLFSPETVRTHFSTSERWRRVLEARQVLGKYLPIAPVLALDEHGAIVEPFIRGQLLHMVDIDVQVQVYRAILRQLTRLVESEVHGTYGIDNARHVLRSVIMATRGSPVYGILTSNEQRLARFLGQAPTVPSHGDLCGNNVVVNDEESTVLDVDQYGFRIFFFDALSMPICSACWFGDPRLLELLKEGEFDAELNDLFQHGRMGDFVRNRQMAILAYMVLSLHVWLPNNANVDSRYRVLERWYTTLGEMLRS